MERQRENPNSSRPYGDNALIDLIKDVGFKVMATLGWLAWIPTALFLFVMLSLLYLMLFPWLDCMPSVSLYQIG